MAHQQATSIITRPQSRRLDFLSFLLIFFSLTPWASWGILNLDSQPWPFLLGLIYIVVKSQSIKFDVFLAAAAVILALGILLSILIYPPLTLFLAVRGVVSYLTLFIVLFCFYDIMRKVGFPYKTVVSVNLLWLLVGVIEFFDPDLLSFLSAQRTTVGRGVTSLAPEPTYFAIYLIFNTWIMLVAERYRPRKTIVFMAFINFLAITFLAKSAMALLYIAVAICFIILYSIIRLHIPRRLYVVLVLVCIGCYIIFYMDLLSDTRIYELVAQLTVSDFRDLVYYDASINARLEHIILPIHGSIYNFGLPGGLANYSSIRNDLLIYYDGLFWYGASPDKIMSWFGAVVFEAGVFGFIAIILIIIALLRKAPRGRTVEIFVLLIFLLGAIPVAFTLVPLLCATMLIRKKLLYESSFGN